MSPTLARFIRTWRRRRPTLAWALRIRKCSPGGCMLSSLMRLQPRRNRPCRIASGWVSRAAGDRCASGLRSGTANVILPAPLKQPTQPCCHLGPPSNLRFEAASKDSVNHSSTVPSNVVWLPSSGFRASRPITQYGHRRTPCSGSWRTRIALGR
jgi:hypothetical protein